MPTPSDFVAKGKILRVESNIVVFNPAGTTYELHLVNQGAQTPAASANSISCYIRAAGRKVWTVPSGGNFVVPIFGPPKIVQGRVRYLDERLMIVHAATPVHVTLPADEDAYDLINGPVTLATLVNATLQPGATFELASVAAAR
jgi:hypothetical protein